MTKNRARRRWTRLISIGIVLGVLSFLAGLSLVAGRQARSVHPLTGRPIAGIATDAQWMDRSAREQEEQPERVGPSGRVYANDIQPGLLQIVTDKATRAKLTNIEPVLGTADDARLPAQRIDMALLVDVYHEFSQPGSMLQSIRRALKPDGRLVLVEYRQEDPTIPIGDTHRMSVAGVRREIEAERFTFEGTIEDLPRQHIIIFRKPAG